jgi:DNA helicase II / ATP-dependent DNA helicase PcrA
VIPPNIVTKISGPPGTGKSTTLLNVVESLLSSGVDPEHIVYTTFTRAGAYEARDRACARFNLPAQRLPYFKTLHALCYGLLPTCDIMQPKDLWSVGRRSGLFFSRKDDAAAQEGYFYAKTKGDALLAMWTMGRVGLKSIDETWTERDRSELASYDITKEEFVRFVETIEKFKRDTGKIDFTDLLANWYGDGVNIHADYIIVDEAQDLSALQWKVVEKLCDHAKQVYIAGDDDQCIHEWNGASPKHLIELKSENYQVLPQSYRIPASVHKLAQSIISKVRHRLPKEYLPREEAGKVERHKDLESLDLGSGTWLLLGRNYYYLDEYVQACRRRGYAYQFSGPSEIAQADQEAMQAVRYWRAVASGKVITAEQAVHMYDYFGASSQIRWGSKGALQKTKADTSVTYDTLCRDYGLIVRKDAPWYGAFDRLSEEQRTYLKKVEDNEGSVDCSPRIRISTIHGAKGQEADHVVLKPDITTMTHEAFQRDPDREHRVFYVGVTRAKQSLHLLQAQSELAYPI